MAVGAADMTEADILSLRSDLTGLVISVVSVSFGMISAYIVGLWLVLKRTPFFLRLVTFVLLSSGLAFMGALMWGLNVLLLKSDEAWAKLGKTLINLDSFGGERPEFLLGLSIYQASAALGTAAFASLYLALAFLTFFYRWPDDLPNSAGH